MNWKLRAMNRATWAGVLAAVTACVYQVLGVLGVVPPVSEDLVVQVLGIVLNLLVGLGVLVDPTTAGVRDSARAMGYDEPWVDGKSEGREGQMGEETPRGQHDETGWGLGRELVSLQDRRDVPDVAAPEEVEYDG